MSGGIDDEKKVVDSNEASKEGEDKVLLETSQDLCEVETDTLRVKIKKDGEELQLNVKAKKEDVAATEKKEDVAATEKKEDVAATEKKEDVAATEKKEDVAATEKKEDAAATEKKEDAAATEKKEDAAATEKKEDAAATEKKEDAAATEKKEDAAIPETPEKAYDEIRSILTSLSTELIPDQQTGTLMLTGAQMKKLNRISLLRAPFFGAPLTNRAAEEAGRPDITTGEDLMNPKSLRKATREMKRMARQERKMKKKYQKYVDARTEYLNAKNSTNYELNKIAYLNQINEVLENGTYINQSFAFMPEVSPLILNLCQKGNIQRLSSGQCVQLKDANNKTINIFTESGSAGARSATGYLSSCGGYSNIAEKWLTEHTKMSQGQARNMLGTLGTFGLVAGVVGVGYRLFTKKEGDSRKFSLPSIGKLAAVIGLPMALNYTSQAATGSGILENLTRMWRTGEFPWSTPDNLNGTEVLASQQAMGQFVLLGIPKKDIRTYGTFESEKMTKIDVGGMIGYMEKLENDPNIPGDQKARLGAQRIALEKIKNDDSANIALNNYIARLGITKSSLDADPDGYLNERLSEANNRYDKMIKYAELRGLVVNSDKKDRVVDALFKEKEVDDKLLDKLKEEGCFMPNPDDDRYKEISKLNISNEKKIKISEAYEKLKKVSEYGSMSLKVDNGKVILTSGTGVGKELIMNPDLSIDGLVNAGGDNLKLKNEEEWLRVGLLVNKIRTSDDIWKETPIAKDGSENWPFTVTSGMQFWGDIKFRKHNNQVLVLSSLLPFLSTMAKNYPTIEEGDNREFFVNYLNKLWMDDPNTSKGTV